METMKIIKHTNYRSVKSTSLKTVIRYFQVIKEEKMPNNTIARTGHFITKQKAILSGLPIETDTMEIIGKS